MKAIGNTKKILLLVGQIQDRIGKAQVVATDDRDPQRMTKLLTALSGAFDICIEITGMYDPVIFTETQPNGTNKE